MTGLSPEMIDALLASGCTPEQVLNAVKSAMEAKRSKERVGAAERKRKQRAREASVTDVTRDECDARDASSLEVLPPAPPSPTPSTPKENPPMGVKRKVPASRIPADYQPDVGWAMSQGLSRAQAEMQAAKFIDHWRGKSGKDGTKADWPATWRNWVRNFLERNGIDAPPPKPIELDDKRWQTRLNYARERQTWAENWGPPPGQPGCQAPRHLLAASDGQNWQVAA